MDINDLVKQALIDQKNIFGDELLDNITIETTHLTEPMKTPLKKKEAKKETKKKEINPEFVVKYTGNSIAEFNELIFNCLRCPLGAERKTLVFGDGDPNAKIMIIGEGPGADEDLSGKPFVGRAGKLLTDILKAINITREEVYIANIVKCRPPGNRVPQDNEIEACIPYLQKQIEIIKPEFILVLGLTAAKNLLQLKDSLTSMRGKVHEFMGAKAMVTYHPAALLRNPAWKKDTWIDVQKFRALYDGKTFDHIK